MKLRINVFFLGFLLSFAFDGKTAEFASWEQKTPNGNIIRNEKAARGGYSINIKCIKSRSDIYTYGFALENLTKWYFYRETIVGECGNGKEKAYFIFDEKKCKKLIFTSKTNFENYLKKSDLKPVVWTRWHTTDWGIFFGGKGLPQALSFLFYKLPFLIVTLVAFGVGLYKTDFNLSHKFNKFSLSFASLILLRVLLDFYPQSI